MQMKSGGTTPSTILMCAIEEPLASELSAALASVNPKARPESCEDIAGCLDRLEESGAELVFSSFTRDFLSLIAAASSRPRKVPVIVVSRCPEVKEWLDAMEAGAADYCASPFESRYLRWMISSNVAEAA
jgi:DNA-binding NtrC family response regulator